MKIFIQFKTLWHPRRLANQFTVQKLYLEWNKQIKKIFEHPRQKVHEPHSL
jgi:hypothetical protein